MGQHLDTWRVIDAVFETSAPNTASCPQDELREIAIAGRSNVGKSSLLNALCGRTQLARVSRTPGRTQMLNSFRVTLSSGVSRLSFRMMDLPGYGFASAKRLRAAFAPMIESYLRERNRLHGLVLLVDLRRGLGALDDQMLAFAAEAGLPALVVGTKADKLSTSAVHNACRGLAAALGVSPNDIAVTSARSSKGVHGPGGLCDDLGYWLTAQDAEEGGASAES